MIVAALWRSLLSMSDSVTGYSRIRITVIGRIALVWIPADVLFAFEEKVALPPIAKFSIYFCATYAILNYPWAERWE